AGRRRSDRSSDGRKRKGPPISRRPPQPDAINQNRLPALNRNHSVSSVFVLVSAWAKSARKRPIGEFHSTERPAEDRMVVSSMTVPGAPAGLSTPHSEPASAKTAPFNPKSGGTPGSGNCTSAVVAQ